MITYLIMGWHTMSCSPKKTGTQSDYPLLGIENLHPTAYFHAKKYQLFCGLKHSLSNIS